jgi:DNA invertase Pin-like site-specific DNA recombinase
MMDAAVYARYSSENQRATSIDDQVALCREAAARFGCSVNGHVYTDAELSGTTSHRPGYQKLLAAAKARQFGAIIVEAQDRLWRIRPKCTTL